MKKAAFVFGYAGGILALVFSLLMIYLAPINFAVKTAEDIKYEMKNENLVALNEVALYAANHPDDPIIDYSESGLIAYATNVAKQSVITKDVRVYEDTMAFVYKAALDGVISIVLVGISIIFALLAFFGSLAVRKHSTGGAVLMLVSSLVLTLSAIQTGTILPMAAASVLLAAAGIFAFVPMRPQIPAEAHARNRQNQQRMIPQGQPFPQPQFGAGYAPYPQYPQQAQPQPQYSPPPQDPAQAAGTGQAGVPFPDEEVQVFTQPNPDEVK